MKSFNVIMQKIFTAAAFAEAGEFETAREVLREKVTTDTPAMEIPKPIMSVQSRGKASNQEIMK